MEDMKPPQREPKTYMAYRRCLELFSSNCAKRFVPDVKREDVLAFIRKLYELGCGPRTAYNRAVIVSQLLKNNGITKLLSNRDWPEYVVATSLEVETLRKSITCAYCRNLWLEFLPGELVSGPSVIPSSTA
jgi:hypothetical protein